MVQCHKKQTENDLRLHTTNCIIATLRELAAVLTLQVNMLNFYISLNNTNFKNCFISISGIKFVFPFLMWKGK